MAILSTQSNGWKVKKQLDGYIKGLPTRAMLMASLLSEKGLEIAKARVSELGAIDTGELLSSLHVEKQGNAIFAVVTDSGHAAFVEFGTGQIGQEGPYPYEFPDGVQWPYMVGEKIFEFKPGQYGWFYYNQDGRLCFTQGMPARPFMYETALMLRDEVAKACKEAFETELK